MSRRSLRGLHRESALRAAGVLPALPTVTADTPLTQLSIAQLDEAGAGLLPVKRCAWCGGVNEAEDEFYCSAPCAIDAMGDI